MPLRLREVATTPDTAINTMRGIAKGIGMKEFGSAQFGSFQMKGSEYGFADLRPTHLRCPTPYAYATAFGRWTHPVLAGAAATNWINTNVHQDAIVLIYGVFNNSATPTITEMYPRFGGEDLPWINMNQINGQWEPQWYFELGYVVSPRQPVQVQLTATGATAALTEEIGLIGEVLARRRYVIVQSAAAP